MKNEQAKQEAMNKLTSEEIDKGFRKINGPHSMLSKFFDFKDGVKLAESHYFPQIESLQKSVEERDKVIVECATFLQCMKDYIEIYSDSQGYTTYIESILESIKDIKP